MYMHTAAILTAIPIAMATPITILIRIHIAMGTMTLTPTGIRNLKPVLTSTF